MSRENVNTSTLTPNRRSKLFNMYKMSYAKIGTTFNTPNAMLNYYRHALVFKNNKGNNRAAILYWPNPKGKKVGLVFGTNSQFQKAVTIPALANLLRQNGWYGELSDALEYLLKRNYKLSPLTNADTIRRTIGIMNLNVKNNGSYTRNIPGVGMHTKRIYGKPRI
jgi:hypothetical protein